jgi:hypothetical protein
MRDQRDWDLTIIVLVLLMLILNAANLFWRP